MVELLVALVAGCYPPGPTPAPTEESNARIQSDCEAQSKKGLTKQAQVPRGLELSPYLGLIYAEGQVLVGGDPNNFNICCDADVVQFLTAGGPMLAPFWMGFDPSAPGAGA